MSNWPVLTLAIALALAVAYVVADFAARSVQAVLRGIIADPEVEARVVNRPGRIIRFVTFVVVAVAIALPAMRMAGYDVSIGANPRAALEWLLNAGLRIAIICAVAYLAIRMSSAAATRFEREMSAGSGLDVIERTKRAQTLGRLVQKTLTVVVLAMAGLMILRELNIDITPVLTGAGIVGLAVGFGAQTLVRDVISGFFMILEDQVRVGDVASINGQGGLVEQVNLRTIVLRDEQGALHVVPNGEVKTLANMSKDFSFYVINVTVDFDEEPDAVAEALRDAGSSLMADPEFKPHILAPIDVYGVDDFQQGRIVIKARIKTVPLKQWMVGRELRKRLARLFKERGIQAPVAQMRVRLDGIETLLEAAGRDARTAAPERGPAVPEP